jgi:hypothetical protein
VTSELTGYRDHAEAIARRATDPKAGSGAGADLCSRTTVWRLVLAATGPGWAGNARLARRHHRARSDPGDERREPALIFLAHTRTSQAKGIEFLGRFMARTEDRNPPTSLALREAQYEAIVEWGIPDHGALQRLTAIGCPTPDHPGRRRPDEFRKPQPPDGRADPRRADPHLSGCRARLPPARAGAGRRRRQRVPRTPTTAS